MYDQFQRSINYLRVSITDRCNLRCRYCRPPEGSGAAGSEALSYEELLRICRCAAALGVDRFKITGGEPLVRAGAAAFMGALKKLPGVRQVTLTTNGCYFASNLPQLLAAGLDGVNFSLDTVDAALYRQLTGGELALALQGVKAAVQAGLPCKLNCVPLAGRTQQELWELLRFADSCGAPLRFIELMPLACNQSLQGLAGAQVRALLSQAGVELQPDGSSYGNGPAVYYRAAGCGVPIGFIEPLHNKFCAACNRVRLTSGGLLKGCLYQPAALDLKKLLRVGASDAALQQALRQAIYNKPAGHGFDACPAGFAMNEIGG